MVVVVVVMTLERYTLKAVVDRLHPFSAVAIEVLLGLSAAMYLLFGFMRSLLFVSGILVLLWCSQFFIRT